MTLLTQSDTQMGVSMIVQGKEYWKAWLVAQVDAAEID